MGRATNATKEYKEKQKERMRKNREKIKNDPVKYEQQKQRERERYHRRKAASKIKIVSQMTEREKRLKRKQWKERSKRYYARKKVERQVAEVELQRMIEENTPPNTPPPIAINVDRRRRVEENNPPHTPPPIAANVDRRAESGRVRRRRHLKKLNDTISVLEEKLAKEKKRANKYKVKLHRIKKKTTQQIDNRTDNSSPSKVVEEMTVGVNVTPEIKKSILFAETIKKQLKINYCKLKRHEERTIFKKQLLGTVVSKYKFKSALQKVTSMSSCKRKAIISKRKLAYDTLKKSIHAFFERDDNTTLTPGIKDTITRHKTKMQKRYLNDTLLSLHKKFTNEQKCKISYQTFCKCRPFWAVQKDINKRDTCKCMLHENMHLIIYKLKINNLIQEKNAQEIIKNVCCKDTKEKCLSRQCEECINENVRVNNDYEKTDTLMYEQWKVIKETRVIKGCEKIIKRTVKIKIRATKAELVNALIASLPEFFCHERNLRHQSSIVRKIKSGLKINDVLIHMDFSENYQCKYAEEVQSAHFGSSKPQLSLHTVVVYRKGIGSDPVPTSFCTVSENLSHDAFAIMAHLEPIFSFVKYNYPEINNFHFVSDGPTTQYRNKTIFSLIQRYLSKMLEAEMIRWHYSEKGHGKGAPDGIGATIKRSADSLVAKGKDIPDFNTFVKLLSNVSPKITVIGLNITEETLNKIRNYIPQQLQTFPGTFKVHEVVYNLKESYMDMRELSCLECKSTCSHFSLGVVRDHERLHYEDVYSSNEDEELVDKELPETETILPQTINLRENDYVLVSFKTRKNVKYYVGRIMELVDNEYLINYLKLQSNSLNFVYPTIQDTSLVSSSDIVASLPVPTLKKRGHHEFNFDFSKYKNVC